MFVCLFWCSRISPSHASHDSSFRVHQVSQCAGHHFQAVVLWAVIIISGCSFLLVGVCCCWSFIFIGGHSFSLVGDLFHWRAFIFDGGGSFSLVGIHFHGVHSSWVALVTVGVVWWCVIGGWVGPHSHLWCSWVVVVVHCGCFFMEIGCCLLLNSYHIAIGNVAPASHVKRMRWGCGVMGLTCMHSDNVAHHHYHVLAW